MSQNRLLGKQWVLRGGGGGGEVPVGRTALQFVLFVKCYEGEKVKEGAIYVITQSEMRIMYSI
jgi:hypothetical protein